MPHDNTILLIIIVIIVLLSLYVCWSLGVLIGLILSFSFYLNYTSNAFWQRHVLTSKVRASISKNTNRFLQAFRNIEWRDFRFGDNMFSQSSWDNNYSNRTTNGTLLNRSAEKRGNITFSVDSRQHSTPLSQKSTSWNNFATKNNITPVKSLRLQRPEKYVLSDTSIYTTPPSTERASPRAIQNSAGPLLASTRYNLGLYADVKSPGLTSRLVKYSEEANRESSKPRLTHNPKYGSPGIFPNVNLSKPSQLPIKPLKRNSIVRISSPDTSSIIGLDKNSFASNYSSPQCQLNQQSPSPSSTDISTRSVLDALKEISRKRIHAKDDNLSDRLKRQRKDLFSNSINESPVTSKRIREQEIQTDESFTASLSPSYKKQKNCSEDIFSSLSSSICLKENLSSKRKAELIPLTPTDKTKQIKLRLNTSPPSAPIISNVKPSPQVSVIEQHQTPIVNLVEPEIPDEPDTNIKINEGSIVNENGVCRLTFVSNPPAKSKDVFVPFKPPSEESKRKRLVALLGALSGEDTGVKSLTEKFFPSENKHSSDTVDSTETKTLTGILSPPKNKDVTKKHVTFDIPENSPSVTSLISNNVSLPSYTASIQSPLVSKENDVSISSQNNVSTSSKSSSFISENPKTTSNNLGLTFTPASSQHNTPQTVSTFSFGADKPITSPNSSGSNQNATPIQSPIASKSITSSSNNTSAIPNITFNAPSQETPKPLGGFKFDLAPISSAGNSSFSSSFNTTVTTTTTSSSNSISFGTPKESSNISFNNPVSTAPNFGFGSFTTSSNVSFGTSAPSTTSNTTFGNITATSSSIGFGSPISSSSTNTTFGNPASYASSNMTFGNPTSTTSTAISFGNPTTTSSAFGSPAPSFGSSTSTFGSTTVTPKLNFGTPTTASNTFGNSQTVTTASFVSSTLNFSAPKPSSQPSSNMFAASIKSTNTFSPTFGSVSKPPESVPSNTSFGAAITKSETVPTFAFQATKSFETKPTVSFTSPFNASPFNKSDASAVASTSSSTPGFAFGNPNSQAQTNTTKPFAFNATPNTTSSNIFGAAPSTTTTSNIFGSPTTTSSTSNFGSSSFGNNTSNFGGFGATQQPPPSFGAVSKPENPFGNSPSNANIFGASSVATAPAFGSTVTTQSFGSTFNTATTTNAFQSPQTNSGSNIFTFGSPPPNATAPQSTAQPFQFGGAPKAVSGGFNFSAGSTNTFNAGQGGSSFGNGAPAVQFGATPNPGGNMFNIGTGSTAARARNPAIRSRKK